MDKSLDLRAVVYNLWHYISLGWHWLPDEPQAKDLEGLRGSVVVMTVVMCTV